MKTDWSNYTIAYGGINYSVNYRDNGDLVACENYVANSPTPKNPQPLISNLPAGTYKTKDWKGDWWEFTLTEDLCGIDLVKDSIEYDRIGHVGYLRRYFNKVTLNGSEAWYGSTTLFDNSFVFNYAPNPAKLNVWVKAISDGFEYMNAAEYQILDNGIGGGLYITIKLQKSVLGTSGNNIDNVNVFKSWLTNNPVIVAYQLATPTRTPLTFTLNNASTAPECPMEFLTDTPSLEYPAEVFDASGTVKVANADESQSVTATIPALRSNAAGTVYDEQNVTTGAVTRRMNPWSNITGANTLTKADSTLLAYKVFKMSLGALAIPKTATTNITAQKYDSTLLTAVNASPTSADRIYTDGSYFYLSAAMADTGFSEACLPSDDEIKAYFYGYRLCHSDGRTPYYKSEVPYNPVTWGEVSSFERMVFDSTGATFVANGTNYNTMHFNTSLKPSTKYGILVNVVSNTANTDSFLFNPNGFIGTPFKINGTGNIKIVITTPSTITYNRLQFFLNVDTSGNTVKIKDIRAYELPTGSQIESNFNTLTADEVAIKYPFDGLNVKHWKQLVGTDAEIAASITPTLPTASYEGFTPYKMIYELAEPIEEQYTPVILPTYYPTTVITTTNNTPAELETTATVKVEDY